MVDREVHEIRAQRQPHRLGVGAWVEGSAGAEVIIQAAGWLANGVSLIGSVRWPGGERKVTIIRVSHPYRQGVLLVGPGVVDVDEGSDADSRYAEREACRLERPSHAALHVELTQHDLCRLAQRGADGERGSVARIAFALVDYVAVF